MKKNKRTFKKKVEALGALICDEILVSYYNVDGINKDEAGEACAKVLKAVGEARANSNVFFDRGRRGFENDKEYSQAKKAFFKALFGKINNDFDKEIAEGLKMFNGSIPAEVREANKKLVSEG